MAKKRRKKPHGKDNKSNLFLFPVLIAIAAVIIGVAYWKVPEDKKQKLRDSYDDAVETVREKVRERLVEISETPEPANGDRLFSYAGLPKQTTYPYPIKVLRNEGYIAGYCEERKNPAWVAR